jgi:hypothetical protein
MSHLDDLDEYEAELELALKREYQAVFGLFRYCVLTQDATYLCNRLDVQQAAPTAQGMPFFQLATCGSGTRTVRCGSSRGRGSTPPAT